MNFRSAQINHYSRQAIREKNLEALKLTDQLTTNWPNEAFKDFSEASLTFYPTFKFDKGTDDYDTSKKSRVPSW
jgi:synaptojanin